MKIEKYQEICKIYDQILINQSAPEIVANQYLHLIKPHPESIKNYNLPRFFKIYLPLRFLLIEIIRILQSIFVKKNNFNNNFKSEVLFVSHLTNTKQLSEDDDAYFGGLPNQLFDQGYKSSIALINPINVKNHKPSNVWRRSKVQRIVLNSTLSFLSEIRLCVAQIKSKKQLNYIVKNLKIDTLITKAALIYHFSSGTFAALRIAIQIENIVKKTNAKYIITTYEGQVWECLVYYYARKANPNIKCFGYQHSAVFEHQNLIRRTLTSNYIPDVILTSGLIAKNLFKQRLLNIDKVSCLGSSRHLPPSFPPCEVNCCLVIPEGFITESLLLFKISLNYAKEHQNQKFIWRLHPLLSFDNLIKTSSIFNNLPNNIYLSKGDLDIDIRNCNSVLYRGSSAVVVAINAGLKPIYYQSSLNEFNIDPIYQFQEGKSIVKNLNELRVALSKDVDQVSRQSLQDFAQDFYMPFNIDNLLKEMIV